MPVGSYRSPFVFTGTLDKVVVELAPEADDDPEARLLWATCGGVRVASAYVPNGRSLDDDHYAYKLAWLAKQS